MVKCGILLIIIGIAEFSEKGLVEIWIFALMTKE